MFSASLVSCIIGEQFRIAAAGGLFLGQQRQQELLQNGSNVCDNHIESAPTEFALSAELHVPIIFYPPSVRCVSTPSVTT